MTGVLSVGNDDDLVEEPARPDERDGRMILTAVVFVAVAAVLGGLLVFAFVTRDDPQPPTPALRVPGTPIAAADPRAATVSEAIIAWGRAPKDADTLALGEWFDPSGPQYAAIERDLQKPIPTRYDVTVQSIALLESRGDRERLAAAFTWRAADQKEASERRFAYEFELVRAGNRTGWRVYTVRELP